jgi:co-chaperonin GroES (HSP10)
MENKINGRPSKAGLLIEFKVKEKTDAGVYLPESAWTMKGILKVLAVGEFCKQVKEGDWIIMSAEARPKTICIEGVIYGMIQEFEVDWIYETPPVVVDEPKLDVITEAELSKRKKAEKQIASLLVK